MADCRAEIQAAVEKGVWPNQKLGAQTKEGDWRKEGQARTWQKVQVLQSCDWTRAWRNCWECQAMCNALSRVFARWWCRCCCGPLWDGSLVSRYASSIKLHFRDWDWREDGRGAFGSWVLQHSTWLGTGAWCHVFSPKVFFPHWEVDHVHPAVNESRCIQAVFEGTGRVWWPKAHQTGSLWLEYV